MTYGSNPYSGYNTYRETSVKTASQGKLVVMLYESAVSHLEAAIAVVGENNKIQAKNIEKFGKDIQKVSDIISELQMTLDMNRGGVIAENLMALYVYFNKELLDASIKHDKKKLTFIHSKLSDLRDSWVIAANSTANTQTQMPVDRPVVNITG